jgi:N-acetylglucosaminyldiphosphoundecaprenol N-acetyl-beta-D-mannosaminyltransferase
MSTLSATSKLRQQVLGYPVDTVDEPLALEIIEEAWRNQRGLHIVTLNAEMVIAAQKDQTLDRIIRHAHLIIPDGSGVVWAMRLHGTKADRLPGIELAQSTLDLAAQKNVKVALIGGKPEVLAKIEATLPIKHPGLKIVAAQNGYFSADEEEELIERVAEAQPELVLVALGVPKQEFFIDKWQQLFPHAVLVGVGGSFDVWAGTVKRAPAVFRKLHLEWFYRLICEPWRFRRMGSALPSFALQVLQEAAESKLADESTHGDRREKSRKAKSHDKSKERSKDK